MNNTIKIGAPIPMLVIGILAYVFAFGKYPDFREDEDRMSNHPFYYTTVWGGISMLPAASLVLDLLGLIVIDHNLVLTIVTLGGLGSWIWGWIIISDKETWNILHADYYGIYVLAILYQTFYIVFGVIVAAKNPRIRHPGTETTL